MAKKDDGYKEQTLEDLKTAPMSKTQKMVIVVAALFLVLFVVYVAVF